MSSDLMNNYIKEMLSLGHSIDVVKEGVKDKGGDPSIVDELIERSKKVVEEANNEKDAVLDYILRHQSYSKATVAAVIVGTIGCVLWATISLVTGYTFGWIACVLGYAVAWSIRRFGKGVDIRYQLLSLIVTLAAMFIGNGIIVIGILSQHFSVPFYELLKLLRSSEFYVVILSVTDLFSFVCFIAAGFVAFIMSIIRLSPEVLVEYALIMRAEKRS